MKTPVSVVIPTKNEANNIRACLEHLAWADEVFVVDSMSADGTVEVAREMGANVVEFEWNRQYPKKKNWAIRNLPFRNEWILIVDADEWITEELGDEIRDATDSPDAMSAYFINRRFMFMGRWIKHSGYYPSWNIRLFRRGMAEYEQITDVADTGSGDNEVHEHMICTGTTGWLRHDMLHFAFPTIDVFVEKHNRYSNWEAIVAGESKESGIKASLFGNALERRRFFKRLARILPFRPSLRFLYGYIVCQGFRDGYEGYVLCRLLAVYEFLSIAKRKERERIGSSLRVAD